MDFETPAYQARRVGRMNGQTSAEHLGHGSSGEGVTLDEAGGGREQDGARDSAAGAGGAGAGSSRAEWTPAVTDDESSASRPAGSDDPTPTDSDTLDPNQSSGFLARIWALMLARGGRDTSTRDEETRQSRSRR